MQSDLKAVKTATLTTEVVDGFEVLHTDSVADTFRLYATITKRLVVQHLLFSPLDALAWFCCLKLACTLTTANMLCCSMCSCLQLLQQLLECLRHAVSLLERNES